MSHLIPQHLIDQLTACPSDSKIRQVAAMQAYIQELLGGTHHTFLQGSYKNDTAISDINDVDIVAIRNMTYSGSHSLITAEHSIPWEQIFSELEQKLSSQSVYVWEIERGDKCIKLRGSFDADIVPAVKIDHDHLNDPICVFSFRSRQEKLNHPRIHYYNGVAKNRLTEGRYKPMVRMFKNWARNHFYDGNVTISSFKIEALVYGCDNSDFMDDKALNFLSIGTSLVQKLRARNALPFNTFSVCGHEDICENWNLIARNNFLNQLNESLGFALEAYKSSDRTIAERKWKEAFNL